ncbi:MAG: hypothetical protein ABL308_09635 [Oceanicaulis sp.]
MKRPARRISALVALPVLLAACESWAPNPPPADALTDVTCDTGGRHGPSGVMDWRCIDGDGVERLPVRSLHEVIDGESNDRQQRRERRRNDPFDDHH